MNKQLTFLTLFLLSIVLYSQNRAIITGKIIYPKEKKVSFEKINVFLYEDPQKVKLNKDGTFYYELELDSSKINHYIFRHGNEATNLYISPNDCIHLELNTEYFDETLVYSGIGSEKNNLEINKFLLFDDSDSKTFKSPIVWDMKADSFLIYSKEIRDDKLLFIDRFANKYPVSLEFLNFIKADVELEYYRNICSFSGSLSEAKFDKIVSDSLNLLKKEIENFDTTNNSFNYIQKVPSYIRYKTHCYLLNNSDNDSIPYFVNTIIVAKKELSKDQFDYYLTYMLNDMLDSRIRYLTFKQYIDVIVPKIDNTYFRYIINTKISKYNKSYKVKISQEAKLHKLSDNFKSIIDKYKGKVIYVDFWASWCAPCVDEMQYYPELRSKINLDNIVFIYISSDINENAYKYAIQKFNIIGEHYRLTKEERNRNHKKYNYNSIPTHMIFDKEGKLINNKAPKPSDKKLIVILQNLTKQ